VLPTSRNTTYGPASPVLSADLDDIQDCIVGAKRPSTPRGFFPAFFNAPANWFCNVGASTYWLSQAGATAAWFTVPVETGDRVTSLQFNVFGDGVADCTWQAWIMSALQVGTKIADIQDINRAAAWGVFDLATDLVTPWANHTFAAGESLLIRAAPTAQNYQIGNGRLIWDRL
jgi:hypothetical protein